MILLIIKKKIIILIIIIKLEKEIYKNNLNNEVIVDKLKLNKGKLFDMLDNTFIKYFISFIKKY